MSSLRNSSRSSNNGTQPSSLSQKKSSLPVRFIKWTMFQVVSFVLAVLILGIGYAAISGVWTDIPSGSGAAGQPVTATLMQNIINDLNNLNGRLTAINPSGTNISATDINLSGNVRTSNGNGYYVNNANYYGDSTNAAVRMPGSFYVQNQAGTQAADIYVKNVNSNALCINGNCKNAWPGIPTITIRGKSRDLGSNSATADCTGSEKAISGGGACSGGNLESSFFPPWNGWYVRCNGGTVDVWAACMQLN